MWWDNDDRRIEKKVDELLVSSRENTVLLRDILARLPQRPHLKRVVFLWSPLKSN